MTKSKKPTPKLVALASPREINKNYEATPIEGFFNNELAKPWEPETESSDDPAAKLHVFTKDGVFTVPADIENTDLDQLLDAQGPSEPWYGHEPEDITLVDGYGSAGWLFGEVQLYNAMMQRGGDIDSRFRVWLSREAESSEWTDGNGMIDEDHRTLVLEFDGTILDTWDEGRFPRDRSEIVRECISYSLLISRLEYDARESGKEEIRGAMRKVLGR